MYIDKLYNQLCTDKEKLRILMNEIKIFSTFDNDLMKAQEDQERSDYDMENKNEMKELRSIIKDSSNIVSHT